LKHSGKTFDELRRLAGSIHNLRNKTYTNLDNVNRLTSYPNGSFYAGRIKPDKHGQDRKKKGILFYKPDSSNTHQIYIGYFQKDYANTKTMTCDKSKKNLNCLSTHQMVIIIRVSAHLVIAFLQRE
jgi:hypothetical protein